MKNSRITQPTALSDFLSFVENETVPGANSTAASPLSCRRHPFSKCLEKSLDLSGQILRYDLPYQEGNSTHALALGVLT